MAYYTSNSDQQIRLAMSAIITYVGGTMFVIGTIGNVMNMVVFCCLKSYRSLTTSVFLAAATFAGQVYLTFSLGVGSLSKIIGYDIASRNDAICKTVLYIWRVSTQVALTSLCLSSIDRYLMTSRSVHRRSLITLARARLLVGICIVVWSCASIPSALYTTNYSYIGLCIPSQEYGITVTYLNLVFSVLLPIIILSVFGLLTWKNLGNIRLTPLNAQVTKMILLDVIVVALSNIPLGCMLIYAVTKSANRLFTATESLLIILAQLFSTIQSTGSFYFYISISSAYRANIIGALHKVFCFWKPRQMNRTGPSTLTARVAVSAMPDVVA